MEQDQQSVYALSARQGLWAGAYFSAIFLLQAAQHGLLLALLGNVMVVAVPFILYRLMARRYRQRLLLASFSELWIHGIMVFLFGSAILALVVYAYLRFINPGLIAQQLAAAIEAYKAVNLTEMASQMEAILKAGALPPPIQFALAMLWGCSFTGSILSLLEAAIIKTFIRK